jgi:hypothetical protein
LLPDSFADGAPQQVAYLHIDLNNAPGELATLEYLFERVVSGGMIILDDYEWAGVYRPQKKAEDPVVRGARLPRLPAANRPGLRSSNAETASCPSRRSTATCRALGELLDETRHVEQRGFFAPAASRWRRSPCNCGFVAISTARSS